MWGFQQALGWMPFLLAFSIVGLLASALLFLRPALHKVLGMLVGGASLAALPAGGGFLVGSVLALSGGAQSVFPRAAKVINWVTLLAVAVALDLLTPSPVSLFASSLVGLAVYALIRRFRQKRP